VLLGYFVTVLLTARRALDAVGSGPAPTGGLPGWKAVGGLFYNAHGVSVRFTDAGGTVGVDFVGTGGGALASLYAVPPAVLLLGGGLTAFRARETSPTRAARTGASVVTGYAVALLAGSFPLGASLGPYSAAPALPVLPGVGYPLVFGAMGGGHSDDSRRRPDDRFVRLTVPSRTRRPVEVRYRWSDRAPNTGARRPSGHAIRPLRAPSVVRASTVTG
jgi:hypothetical protein